MLTTIFLAQRGIGLAKDAANTVSSAAPSSQSASPQTSEAILLRPGDVLRALTPLLATVGILLLTRIPFFGLRQLLTSERDWVLIPLGRLGEFSISPSLVFQFVFMSTFRSVCVYLSTCMCVCICVCLFVCFFIIYLCQCLPTFVYLSVWYLCLSVYHKRRTGLEEIVSLSVSVYLSACLIVYICSSVCNCLLTVCLPSSLFV